MQFLSKAFDFKRWELQVLFILIYAGIFYLTNKYVTNDAYYYSAFGNKLSTDRIEELINNRKNLIWIYYAAQPIIILGKLYLLAGLLYSGGLLFNLALSYDNSIKVILLAELVMALQSISKTVYWLFYTPRTTQDVSNFSPLSIVQLIRANTYPDYFFYPLQLFNLFELAYWIVLIFGVIYFAKVDFKKSFSLVACSYGVGLFVWIIVVMFIKVQFS
jgi:hypothetical protein